MSYTGTGIGIWGYVADAGARLVGSVFTAASGQPKQAERTARNVEQTARAELQAAQAGAQGTQQAAQVTAEGQVATAQARADAERQAAEKRNKTVLIGAAAVAGVLGLAFVGYRLTRNP